MPKRHDADWNIALGKIKFSPDGGYLNTRHETGGDIQRLRRQINVLRHGANHDRIEIFSIIAAAEHLGVFSFHYENQDARRFGDIKLRGKRGFDVFVCRFNKDMLQRFVKKRPFVASDINRNIGGLAQRCGDGPALPATVAPCRRPQQ